MVLGHFGVGKTSLIRRFVTNTFSESYKVSIGVHISKKVVILPKGESISLILWDLEGTDDPGSIRTSYLLGTHGALFVFDLSRPSTFQNISRELATIKEKIPGAPILVVGNKADLVITDRPHPELREAGVSYDYLTSAKTGDTVETAFLNLAKQLVDGPEKS